MLNPVLNILTVLMSSLSFVWAFISWRKDKHRNQAKNEFDLAKPIFEHALVIDIPAAYDNWYTAADKSQQREFYDLICSLRKRSLYFQYRYKSFYSETLVLLQKLENEIGLANNKLNIQEKKQNEANIEFLLDSIYKQYFQKLLLAMEKK